MRDTSVSYDNPLSADHSGVFYFKGQQLTSRVAIGYFLTAAFADWRTFAGITSRFKYPTRQSSSGLAPLFFFNSKNVCIKNVWSKSIQKRHKKRSRKIIKKSHFRLVFISFSRGLATLEHWTKCRKGKRYFLYPTYSIASGSASNSSSRR